jgi:hypothetical protein
MRKPMRLSTLLLAAAIIAAVSAPAYALDLQQLRKDIADKGASWSAGYTEPALMREVFGRNYVNPDSKLPDIGDAKPFVFHREDPLPTTLDWRDKDGVNYVTHVRNQWDCGSCWAFATTGPIETHVAIAENWPDPKVDLSEQQLLSCSYGGCDGGFTTTSFDYARDSGLAREECMGYVQSVTSCDMCPGWESDSFKIDSWDLVTTNPLNTDAIKAALQIGPVATSITIYEDFFYYEDGVYEHVSGGYQGLHALTIIGYDDSEQSWIVKNSWGGLWGKSGFGRIKWGAAFIGLMTILPHYTSQGLGPEPPDDDAADDAQDDDVADDAADDTVADDEASDDTDDKQPISDAGSDGDDDDDDDGGCCG